MLLVPTPKGEHSYLLLNQLGGVSMFDETYQNGPTSDPRSLPNPDKACRASCHALEPPAQRLVVSLEPLCISSHFSVRVGRILSFTPIRHHRPAVMTRNQQLVYPGLGKNYTSPERPGRRSKNQLLVSRPGQQSKRDVILKRIRELDERAQNVSSVLSEHVQDVFDAPAADSEMDWIDEPAEEPAEYFHNVPKDAPKRRKLRDHKLDTLKQYKAWQEIIPSFVEPLLRYIGSTTAGAAPQIVDIPACSHCDGSKTSRVLCLFWDRK
jgi:hypothetical protein